MSTLGRAPASRRYRYASIRVSPVKHGDRGVSVRRRRDVIAFCFVGGHRTIIGKPARTAAGTVLRPAPDLRHQGNSARLVNRGVAPDTTGHASRRGRHPGIRGPVVPRVRRGTLRRPGATPGVASARTLCRACRAARPGRGVVRHVFDS